MKFRIVGIQLQARRLMSISGLPCRGAGRLEMTKEHEQWFEKPEATLVQASELLSQLEDSVTQVQITKQEQNTLGSDI
jgi:hypothetical protein